MAQGDESLLAPAGGSAGDGTVAAAVPVSPLPSRGSMPVGTISYGPPAAEQRAPDSGSARAPVRPGLTLRDGGTRSNGGLMAPLIVGAALLGLGALGTAGIVVVKSMREARDLTERIGPALNLGKLPAMTFAVGPSSMIVDVHARLEYDSDIDATIADPFAARIFDLIADRLSTVRPHEMRGAAGAQLMKRTISGAVNQEIGPVRVRAVLLDRFIIR